MKKLKSRQKRKQRVSLSRFKTFYFFSSIILLAKLIWLNSLPGRGLLGADGENYIEALDGLLSDGFYSHQQKLSYWPAGYPIFMWPFAKLISSDFPFYVGIFQSLIFALVTAFFASELKQGPLKKFAWPSLLILNLSPTLSMNSVAIGYEVLAATMLLLSITLYLGMIRKKSIHALSIECTLAASSLAFAIFLQPRIFLLSLGILIPFAIYHFRGKSIAIFLASSLFLCLIPPGILITRNLKANNFAAISTNLGITMNIGAGPNSSGGYSNSAAGVPCSKVEGNASKQDSHLVKCVILWYLENPKKSLELMRNKFFFHWSPWFGPLANGTSARNPWLKMHPFSKLVESEDGFDFIYGIQGKIVSWIWIASTLILTFLGFFGLRRRGNLSTLLAWMLVTPVVLNTLSSMATIGDNRFRIPTLSLSNLLQLFGIYFVFSRTLFRKEIEGQAKLNQGLIKRVKKEAE